MIASSTLTLTLRNNSSFSHTTPFHDNVPSHSWVSNWSCPSPGLAANQGYRASLPQDVWLFFRSHFFACLGESQIWGQCMLPKPHGHKTIYRKFNLYVLLPRGSLWMFRCIRDLIPHCPRGRILRRSKIWGQCTLPKPNSHQATQVCWPDSICEVLGSMGMSVHPENRAPAMGQLPLFLRGRFFSQRLGEGHSDRKPTALWSPQPS